MKRWFIASAIFGLLAPLIVRVLIHEHVRLSGVVVASVWPTILVIATGAFGMTDRLLFGLSVLLNAAVYGAMGCVMGLISRRRRRRAMKPPKSGIPELQESP